MECVECVAAGPEESAAPPSCGGTLPPYPTTPCVGLLVTGIYPYFTPLFITCVDSHSAKYAEFSDSPSERPCREALTQGCAWSPGGGGEGDRPDLWQGSLSDPVQQSTPFLKCMRKKLASCLLLVVLYVQFSLIRMK